MRLRGPLRKILDFHAQNRIADVERAKSSFRDRSVYKSGSSEKLTPDQTAISGKYTVPNDITKSLAQTKTTFLEGIECVHDVPYIHQGHVNLCGDACVEMIRRYYGNPSERSTKLNSRGITVLNHNPRRVFAGLSEKSLVQELSGMEFELLEVDHTSLNLPPLFFKKEISDFIQQGPLVLAYRGTALSGHCIVIIGVIGDKLVIHDPWSGGNDIRPVQWLSQLLGEGRVSKLYLTKQAEGDSLDG